MNSMDADIEEVLYTEEQIVRRVGEIGAQLTEEYKDKVDDGIVVISVLRGAALFACDLMRAIELPLEVDFMALSSYGDGTKSSGVVRVQKDLSSDIEGKHVIIAEDVLDSGLTLSYLIKMLQSRNPASVAVVAFLRKETPAQADIDCKVVGFNCPDKFIVGYGLDYAERYRNLRYVGVLKPAVYGE